jgi:hypothetical protein
MQSSVSSRTSCWIAAIGFLVVFVVLLPKIPPFEIHFIADELDPSWVQASIYALLNRLRFGQEFVFTTGPLSPIYSGTFSEGFTLITVSVRLLVVVFVAYGIVSMTAPLWASFSLSSFLVASAALIALWHVHAKDSINLFVPILTALFYMDRRGNSFVILTGTVLSAALSLSKFSAFPLSVAAFALVDLLSIHRREVPYKTAFFVGSVVLFFKLTGQNLSDFLTFIIAGLEIASGYAAAMSLPGLIKELVSWLFIATVCAFAIFVGERKRLKSNETDLPSSICRMLLFCLFAFVLFKSSFIRHDLHSLIAWGGLALAAIAFQIFIPSISFRDRFRIPLLSVIAIVSALSATYMLARRHNIFPNRTPFETLKRSWAQIEEGARLAMAPGDWLAEKSRQSQEAARAIAFSANLPALKGTVDIIPSRQSRVIAAGLDYHPRPVVQEYATYSEKLIARNRAFFESDSAPEYLLFEPGSIDGRHPASAEGSLWPLFLQRYYSADLAGRMIVLRKREKPLPSLLKPAELSRMTAGAWSSLPAGADPLFVKIDLRLNFFGKLYEFFFRPPLVHLAVGYPVGAEELFRLIPGQARDGMLISPKVDSALPYLLLDHPEAEANKWQRWPSRLRIDIGMLGRLLYSRSIMLSIQRLDRNRLQAARIPGSDTVVSRISDIWPLLRENTMNYPVVQITNDGVFAVAGTTLKMQTGNADRLDVSFGMRPAPYSDFAGFYGVCFAVSVQHKEGKLFEKCLNPKERPADSERQAVSIPVPPNSVLELKTICGVSCDYGWSYWGSVRLN